MFRAKDQKRLRLSNGVSTSQFLSMALFCSVSGQKIKSFVTAEMHFVQRVLPYCGTGEMKAEGGRGRQNKRTRRRRQRKKSRKKDNEDMRFEQDRKHNISFPLTVSLYYDTISM